VTNPEEPPAKPTSPTSSVLPARTLRRADLAALLVGIATLGYTAFAVLQPIVDRDRTEAAAPRRPLASSTAPANVTPATGSHGRDTSQNTSQQRSRSTADVSSAPASTRQGFAPGSRSSTRPRGTADRQPGTTRNTTKPLNTTKTVTATATTTATTTATDSATTATTNSRFRATVPCSLSSLTQVTVTFVNTSSTPVDLQWSDFGCRRVSYGIVPPGGNLTLRTWVTHAWAFTDAATGQTRSTHVIWSGDRIVNMP